MANQGEFNVMEPKIPFWNLLIIFIISNRVTSLNLSASDNKTLQEANVTIPSISKLTLKYLLAFNELSNI